MGRLRVALAVVCVQGNFRGMLTLPCDANTKIAAPFKIIYAGVDLQAIV